ncbi:MAG: PEGA domain-containing protein [Byssovorax sp.]
MKTRSLVLVLALATPLLLGRPAFAADPPDQGRTLFNAGAQAYAAGQFTAAIQAFDECYRLDPRPGVLFSIAQAHRRQYYVDKRPEHLKLAIQNYRDYLTKVTDGGRRADAAQALSELEPVADRLGTSAAPAAPAAPPETRLMVSSPTHEATVSVDQGKAMEAPLITEIKPGKHSLHLTAPGYFDEDREINASAGGVAALDIALREKPGLLVIKARDGALLTIDGRYVATTPLPRPLEIDAGHHLIALAKNGYYAHTEEIDVGRAETKTLDVTLGATKQRVAAYVLLGTGAAGILVGGVFAGLAAHQQSLAQDIDATRQTKGYDCRDAPADCPTKAYQDAVDQRNQLRPIAGIALTAGAVVAATGAVLFLFDQPSLDPRAARSDTKARPMAPPPKATPLEISAAPAIGPGFYGGSFVGRF